MTDIKIIRIVAAVTYKESSVRCQLKTESGGHTLTDLLAIRKTLDEMINSILKSEVTGEIDDNTVYVKMDKMSVNSKYPNRRR